MPDENKPKSVVVELPQVHRISGDVNAMLDQTVADRFKSILLVPSNEPEDSKLVKAVLTHAPDKKDPNVQVSTWNTGLGHTLRFIQACVDAWTSGTGLSGDGSSKYILENSDKLFKVLPQIKQYDLYLVPNGRSGAGKYRIPIPDLVSQVKERAKVIANCVEKYGFQQGKERTKKSNSAPEMTVQL